MKCKFAQFLFRAFGITGGALAVLFVIYYYNLDMKLMRSEAFIDELKARGEVCPQCGRQEWTLGYPMGTTTGFVKF